MGARKRINIFIVSDGTGTTAEGTGDVDWSEEFLDTVSRMEKRKVR